MDKFAYEMGKQANANVLAKLVKAVQRGKKNLGRARNFGADYNKLEKLRSRVSGDSLSSYNKATRLSNALRKLERGGSSSRNLNKGDILTRADLEGVLDNIRGAGGKGLDEAEQILKSLSPDPAAVRRAAARGGRRGAKLQGPTASGKKYKPRKTLNHNTFEPWPNVESTDMGANYDSGLKGLYNKMTDAARKDVTGRKNEAWDHFAGRENRLKRLDDLQRKQVENNYKLKRGLRAARNTLGAGTALGAAGVGAAALHQLNQPTSLADTLFDDGAFDAGLFSVSKDNRVANTIKSLLGE